MTPVLAQRPRSDRGFERLYKRHVGDVYRYALAVMRNPADAEDVTQTTFLNAYRVVRRERQPPREAAELADRDRAQRLPAALQAVVEAARRGRLRGRHRRHDRRRRHAERRGHPACARSSRLQPARRTRHARAGRPLVRRDRRDPRRLDERRRDADLPRATRTARAARRLDHVRRGRVRDLATARRSTSAWRARPASRASPRVRRVLELRAASTRTTRCAEDACARSRPDLADVALRRRQRSSRRDRTRAQGRSRCHRRPCARRCRLRGCATRAVARSAAECGRDREVHSRRRGVGARQQPVGAVASGLARHRARDARQAGQGLRGAEGSEAPQRTAAATPAPTAVRSISPVTRASPPVT